MLCFNMKTVNIFVAFVIAYVAFIGTVEVETTPQNQFFDPSVVSGIGSVRIKRETFDTSNLIELALKYSAQFSKICLERLAGDIFGSGRASRSTDVAIFNKSNFKFQCTSSKCDSGSYTSSLLPEQEIAPKQYSVFGMESTRFFSGLRCVTKYESDDGTFFEIETSNPFFRSNSVSESNSPTLVLTHTLGSGNNNQVRWIIDDINDINIRSDFDSDFKNGTDFNVQSGTIFNSDSGSNFNYTTDTTPTTTPTTTTIAVISI